MKIRRRVMCESSAIDDQKSDTFVASSSRTISSQTSSLIGEHMDALYVVSSLVHRRLPSFEWGSTSSSVKSDFLFAKLTKRLNERSENDGVNIESTMARSENFTTARILREINLNSV